VPNNGGSATRKPSFVPQGAPMTARDAEAGGTVSPRHLARQAAEPGF